jgi:hypothetical protein
LSSTSNFKIFLSHASEDADLTNKIHGWLLNQSFIDKVWIDKIELNIGDNLIEKINQGVSSSDYLVPLITNNSRNRKWDKYEIKIAMKEETNITYKVLPLVHNDCKKVPKYLEHKIYLRIDDSLTGLDKIIESITNRYRLEIKLNSNFKLNENDLREKLNLYSRHRKNLCYVNILHNELTSNIIKLIKQTMNKIEKIHGDDLTEEKAKFAQFKLTIELLWNNLNYLLSNLINTIFDKVKSSIDAINYIVQSLINLFENLYFSLVQEIYEIISHFAFLPPLSNIKKFYNEYFTYVRPSLINGYLYFLRNLHYKNLPSITDIIGFFTKLHLRPKYDNTYIPRIFINDIDLFEMFQYDDRYPLDYIFSEDTWYSKCVPQIINDYINVITFRQGKKCTELHIGLTMKDYEFAAIP